MMANVHAFYIQTDEALLAKLRPSDGPLFVSPPCAHFSFQTDFDEVAQDIIEGRHRHRPRNVFAPNSFSKHRGRK
ncbi:hypothetical protein GGQ73_003044 [Rhizobium skierniewicense]|uniref:Uncharacterized protein n=1 Tax=Rhizobium skierniewicense TaxID=984260 RepID=A0A7W6C7A5_9HYPH|nr:hypothetical protein [Rhizobium skierniewicense]MBB3947080.1 hypothetical protein [Rhizobium skierniewicense]